MERMNPRDKLIAYENSLPPCIIVIGIIMKYGVSKAR